MKVLSEKAVAKRAFMSKIFKQSWQYVKNDEIDLSAAIRKSWLIDEILKQGYDYGFELFEVRTVFIRYKFNSSLAGSVRITHDGFYYGRTVKHSAKVTRKRQEAVSFAVSNQVNKYMDQIPLF